MVTGTARALFYYERSQEVCEYVAEIILERRRVAGVRSPPSAGRKIVDALHAGMRFVEDQRGLVVPAEPLEQGALGPTPPPPGKKKKPRKKPRRQRSRD